MPDNKPFPEINGLLSGLRTFDNPSRPSPSPTVVQEQTTDALSDQPATFTPVEPMEATTLWDEFMNNLREYPRRCRKPDRLVYHIDKDIADSISECNIEKRSNSDIINAILRTFLSQNLDHFNQYRQESKTLFDAKRTLS